MNETRARVIESLDRVLLLVESGEVPASRIDRAALVESIRAASRVLVLVDARMSARIATALDRLVTEDEA